MKTIQVPDAATARQLFEEARGTPVLLREESGRAFVLVEVDRDDAETLILAESPKLHEILDRSRARAKREGWLSTGQVRKELGVE